MPSASANIIAKFIAQIDTGVKWSISTRVPAEAASPATVSRSGSPAATSVPKASTRMPRVTGQDSSSDLIIASWLAVLKSLHIMEEPVALTWIVVVDRAVSGPFRSSAALTISLVSAPAPPRMTAVLPSRLMVDPGCGATTSEMSGLALSRAVARPMTFCTAGSVTGRSALTTTWRAAEESPPKCFWASSRTATESEPSACQPAPASVEVAEGASAPSPAIRISQITPTRRRWAADHRPRRPRGPGGEPPGAVGSVAAGDAATLSVLVMESPLLYPWGYIFRRGEVMPCGDIATGVCRSRWACGSDTAGSGDGAGPAASVHDRQPGPLPGVHSTADVDDVHAACGQGLGGLT